jgi:hypothetical protein
LIRGARWFAWLGAVLVTSVFAPGCSGCSCTGDPGDVSPSGPLGGAGGSGGITSSGSSNAGGSGGQGGEGGSGANGATQRLGATETVTAGEVARSARYRMVFTLGQPTQNQDATRSQKYRMQGGLVGANGSPP